MSNHRNDAVPAKPPVGPLRAALSKGSSFVDALNRIIGEGSGFIYLAVFVIGFQEVIRRYLFGAPTTWALEVSIALCGIQYCLAAGNTHRLGRHVRIYAVYSLFSRRGRQVCDVVSETVVLFTVASIVYGGGIQAERALSVWQTTGSAFDSPAPTLMKLAIPIGAFLILLQSLVRLSQFGHAALGRGAIIEH